MKKAKRHDRLDDRLEAVPRLGLPVAGLTIMFSDAKSAVETAYLWIGEKRQPSHGTLSRAGGALNVDVDAEGNFIGLEMLRKITDAEARRFYRWAHRRWAATKDRPHWPCSALGTLLRAWDRAEEIVDCPGCRDAGRQASHRWTPEAVGC